MARRRNRRKQVTELSENLMQWGLFTVGITLTPLIFNYLLILLTTPPPHPDLSAGLTQRGELLIVAAAILGEATSDLFKKSHSKNYKLFVGGICILLLIIACLLFGAIQTSFLASFSNAELIRQWSALFFFISLLCGVSCKILAKA